MQKKLAIEISAPQTQKAQKLEKKTKIVKELKNIIYNKIKKKIKKNNKLKFNILYIN